MGFKPMTLGNFTQNGLFLALASDIGGALNLNVATEFCMKAVTAGSKCCVDFLEPLNTGNLSEYSI